MANINFFQLWPDKENAVKKGQLGRGHLLLFAIAILGVGYNVKEYIRIAQRDAPSQVTGGRTPPQRGGGGQGGGGMQRGSGMLERMTQELKLSVSQQSQIKKIQDGNMPQLQQVRANNALSPKQKRVQMRLLRTQTQNRIKQILTPEQQTKYDTMQTAMRGRFQGGGSRGSGSAEATR